MTVLCLRTRQAHDPALRVAAGAFNFFGGQYYPEKVDRTCACRIRRHFPPIQKIPSLFSDAKKGKGPKLIFFLKKCAHGTGNTNYRPAGHT